MRAVLFIATLSAGVDPDGEAVTRIVMMGDSTTLCSRNEPGKKLTDYVTHILTTEYQRDIVVINAGVGRDTAKGGFFRTQSDVLAHRPDVVTLSFGLNDLDAMSPDEYRAWMERIIERIQAQSDAAILLITSTPLDNNRHVFKDKYHERGGLDESLDKRICATTREVASHYRLPLCDLHAHFRAIFDDTPARINDLILPDGVHLTDEGNEVAAAYVAPYIEAVLAQEDGDDGL